MLQLLQSIAHTKPRTVQFPVLPCQQGSWGALGAGRGQNKDRWVSLAKGTFHTLHHTQQ